MSFDGLGDVFGALSAEDVAGEIEGCQRPLGLMLCSTLAATLANAVIQGDTWIFVLPSNVRSHGDIFEGLV